MHQSEADFSSSLANMKGRLEWVNKQISYSSEAKSRVRKSTA